MPGRGPTGPVHPSEVLPAPTQAVPVIESVGAFVGGGAAADESDRPLPWRDQLPEYVLGGAGPVPGRGQRTWLERPGVQAGRADQDRPGTSGANRYQGRVICLTAGATLPLLHQSWYAIRRLVSRGRGHALKRRR